MGAKWGSERLGWASVGAPWLPLCGCVTSLREGGCGNRSRQGQVEEGC